MPEIEVRATRSFMHPLHPNGQFLRQRRYQVDTDNPVVQGLIDGGYLVPTVKLEVTRVVGIPGLDEFLGSGVGTRRTRPKKSKAAQGFEVTDGQGEPEPGADQHHGDDQGPDVGFDGD